MKDPVFYIISDIKDAICLKQKCHPIEDSKKKKTYVKLILI